MEPLHPRAVSLGALAFILTVFPGAVFAQSIRIADMSMNPHDVSARAYPLLSRAAARFDIVAAVDVEDTSDMEKVLSGMDENWEALMSRRGFFGFLYSDRVQVVRDLGTYRGTGTFPVHGSCSTSFSVTVKRLVIRNRQSSSASSRCTATSRI